MTEDIALKVAIHRITGILQAALQSQQKTTLLIGQVILKEGNHGESFDSLVNELKNQSKQVDDLIRYVAKELT